MLDIAFCVSQQRFYVNKVEQEIYDFLEKNYCGARAMDDLSCQIRLARAIAAFKSDPEESYEDLFTENFISKYVLDVN